MCIFADGDVDNLNFPPRGRAIMSTNTVETWKSFKVQSLLVLAFSKTEKFFKFGHRVKQNDWKNFKLKKNSPIFKWKYPNNYEFHRKIHRNFCSSWQNQSKSLMLNKGKIFLVGKLEQVKNSWNFKTKVWLDFI